jgi:hypothetical protein
VHLEDTIIANSLSQQDVLLNFGIGPRRVSFNLMLSGSCRGIAGLCSVKAAHAPPGHNAQVNARDFEADLVQFLEGIGEDRLAKNVRGKHVGW